MTVPVTDCIICRPFEQSAALAFEFAAATCRFTRNDITFTPRALHLWPGWLEVSDCARGVVSVSKVISFTIYTAVLSMRSGDCEAGQCSKCKTLPSN